MVVLWIRIVEKWSANGWSDGRSYLFGSNVQLPPGRQTHALFLPLSGSLFRHSYQSVAVPADGRPLKPVLSLQPLEQPVELSHRTSSFQSLHATKKGMKKNVSSRWFKTVATTEFEALFDARNEPERLFHLQNLSASHESTLTSGQILNDGNRTDVASPLEFQWNPRSCHAMFLPHRNCFN